MDFFTTAVIKKRVYISNSQHFALYLLH